MKYGEDAVYYILCYKDITSFCHVEHRETSLE